MKISKNSWHYRFLNYFDWPLKDASNLCTYFWGYVLCLLMLVLFCLLIPIFGIAYLWMRVWESDWLENWRNKRKPLKDQRSKQPSIIVEYIRAKKNKICPPIEFTDD
jgi:hypothetical protein